MFHNKKTTLRVPFLIVTLWLAFMILAVLETYAWSHSGTWQLETPPIKHSAFPVPWPGMDMVAFLEAAGAPAPMRPAPINLHFDSHGPETDDIAAWAMPMLGRGNGGLDAMAVRLEFKLLTF